jgi:hypothetical protein
MDPLLAIGLMILVAIVGFLLGALLAVQTAGHREPRRSARAFMEYVVPLPSPRRPRPHYRTPRITVSPGELAIDLYRLPRAPGARRDLRLPR